MSTDRSKSTGEQVSHAPTGVPARLPYMTPEASESRVTEARSQLRSLLSSRQSDDQLSAALAEILRLMSVDGNTIGRFVGNYEIVDFLGEGGMGEVYLAVRPDRPQVPVALKVIKRGMDSRQVVARFHLEYQLLQQLDHPNIAKFVESGITEEGNAYFVMEFVRGLPITDYCNHNRVTVQDRVRLFASACEAMHHAGTKGIIHRDLKPSNILVTEQQNRPVVKIIDFGLAKALSCELEAVATHSRPFQWVGTMNYMSPEQSAGIGDIDIRTDVYSLGVILFELLSGSTPLPKENLMRLRLEDWRYKILEADTPSPSERIALSTEQEQTKICLYRSASTSQLLRQIRGNLDAICRKALEKEREDRYATPQELANDIAAHLAHRSIKARRRNVGTRVADWCRRNQRYLGFAVLLMLLVACGVALAYARWTFVTAQQRIQASARDRTQQEAFRIRRELVHNLYEAGIYLHNGDRVGAQQIVQRQLNSSVGESRDHFLLRYLQYQMVDADQVFSGTIGTVLGIDLAAKNGWIASGSRAGEIIVWDTSTGNRLHRSIISPHEVISVAFSPDEKYLATAGQDSVIRIWDTTTWTIAFTLGKNDHSVRSVAWSPDGRHLATGNFIGRVQIWDLASHKVDREFQLPDAPLASLSWSPDGKKLASSCNNFGTYVWETTDWTQIAHLHNRTSWVRSVDYSDDSRYLAIGNYYGSEVRIHAASDCSLHQVLPISNRAHSVWFTKNHDLLVGTANGLIERFSYSPRTKLWFHDRSINLSFGYADILSARLSPDNEKLFVASMGGKMIKQLSFRRAIGCNVYTSYGRPIGAIPQLGVVLSIDGDKQTTYVGEYAGDLAKPTHSFGHMARAESYPAYSARTQHVALAEQTEQGYQVDLVDTKTWEIKAVYPAPAKISQLSFSPDGSQVLASCGNGVVRLYDVATGKSEDLQPENFDSATLAQFSPRSTIIAMGTDYSRNIVLVDATTRVRLGEISTTLPWRTFTFNNEGTVLAISELDRVSFWNVDDLRPLEPSLRTTALVDDIAFSADGQTVATLANNGTLTYWDYPLRARCYSTVTPQSRSHWIEFTPSNTVLCGVYESDLVLEFGSE